MSRLISSRVISLSLLFTLFFLGGSSRIQGANSNKLLAIQAGSVIEADLQGDAEILTLAAGTALDPYNPYPPEISFYTPLVLPKIGRIFMQNWSSNEIWVANLGQGNSGQWFWQGSLYPALGVAASPDEKLLAIAITNDELGIFLQIVDIATGQATDQIPLPFIAQGCGGGPFLPDEWLYIRQTGPAGNRLLLSWSEEQTIMASRGCDGSGVQQIDLSLGTSTDLLSDIYRVQLDPTKRYLAGIQGKDPATRHLAVFDRQTLELVQEETELGFYDQFAFSDDGMLYFTTVRPRGIIPVEGDNIRLIQDLFWGMTDPVTLYEVSIYQWNLESGALKHLWTDSSWRAISKMVIVEKQIYLTAIENLEPLMLAFNQNEAPDAVIQYLPKSDIYVLSLEDDTPKPHLWLENSEVQGVY